MNGVENSCGTYASSALWCSLVDGVKWLKHATKVISASCNFGRCKLSEAEEVLSNSQVLSSFFLLSFHIYILIYSVELNTWILWYLSKSY